MEKRGFKDTELFLLHEIVIALDQIARVRILEPEGMTYPEFLVLMAAREFSAPTQEEVSGYLNMSASLVSQRVSSLVRKGFILQETIPENKRKVKLSLTENGKEKLEKIYTAMAYCSDGLFDSLGPGRSVFRDTLARLGDGLKAELGADCSGDNTGGKKGENNVI